MRLIDADALQFEPDPVDNIMNRVLFVRGRSSGKTLELVKVALKHMIDSAPTVDPNDLREKGKWEVSEEHYLDLYAIKCSKCHEEWYFDEEGDVVALCYKFCPNCGARMDGDNDG